MNTMNAKTAADVATLTAAILTIGRGYDAFACGNGTTAGASCADTTDLVAFLGWARAKVLRVGNASGTLRVSGHGKHGSSIAVLNTSWHVLTPAKGFWTGAPEGTALVA